MCTPGVFVEGALGVRGCMASIGDDATATDTDCRFAPVFIGNFAIRGDHAVTTNHTGVCQNWSSKLGAAGSSPAGRAKSTNNRQYYGVSDEPLSAVAARPAPRMTPSCRSSTPSLQYSLRIPQRVISRAQPDHANTIRLNCWPCVALPPPGFLRSSREASLDTAFVETMPQSRIGRKSDVSIAGTQATRDLHRGLLAEELPNHRLHLTAAGFWSW
jgi:hypothetical protein